MTITVATNVAQLFQINEVFQASPQLHNKLTGNPNEGTCTEISLLPLFCY